MVNITIRNIPDDVLEKIKRLSSVERRSLNSELLRVIERGAMTEMAEKMNTRKNLSKSMQINLWENLSGRWKDTRSTEEIIEDIRTARTPGREFSL